MVEQVDPGEDVIGCERADKDVPGLDVELKVGKWLDVASRLDLSDEF